MNKTKAINIWNVCKFNTNPRLLLCTIKSFFEQTTVIRKRGIGESFWLLNINFFFNIPIDKICSNIYLLYLPISSCCNSKNWFIAYKLNNKEKCLVIIHTFLLLKTFDNPSNYETDVFSYRSSLELEYLFSAKTSTIW